MSNRTLLLFVFCGLVASASAQTSFNRYTFNAGGGLGIGKDEVASFVGNSFFGQVGGGRNFNRWFGLDAEYMYYDLGLRPSVSQSQGLNDASGSLQSITLNGIVNIPYHLGKFGAYGIFGGGYYRRAVSANNQTILTNSPCQPTWARWWGINCFNGFPTSQQTLSSYSLGAGGFDYGGGITYQLNHLHKAKLFGEFRYHRAYQSDGQTIVMPIAFGLRW